jgi:hypothetical protein
VEREPIEVARDHAFHPLERFAFRHCWRYYAQLAVGIRAMAMVVEPAVFVSTQAVELTAVSYNPTTGAVCQAWWICRDSNWEPAA